MTRPCRLWLDKHHSLSSVCMAGAPGHMVVYVYHHGWNAGSYSVCVARTPQGFTFLCMMVLWLDTGSHSLYEKSAAAENQGSQSQRQLTAVYGWKPSRSHNMSKYCVSYKLVLARDLQLTPGFQDLLLASTS